jgi:hypothetical protein
VPPDDPDDPEAPEPELDEPESDEVVGAAGAGAAALFASPPLLAALPLAAFEPPDFADEYRSAYQPPPLRMKLPPLIWRLAVFCPHFGHVSDASAVMR